MQKAIVVGGTMGGDKLWIQGEDVPGGTYGHGHTCIWQTCMGMDMDIWVACVYEIGLIIKYHNSYA